MIIRDATDDDVPAMTRIQNALIPTTTVEWRDDEHTVEERRAWLTDRRAAGHTVLIAEQGEEVIGWAAYGDFRDSRKWPGYRHTVEHTVHVHAGHQGHGVGRRLMEELIARAAAKGLHVMVAGVDGENTGSIRFHESLGFRVVARLPEVGTKFGRWLDLVLLQRNLDESRTP